MGAAQEPRPKALKSSRESILIRKCMPKVFEVETVRQKVYVAFIGTKVSMAFFESVVDSQESVVMLSASLEGS